MYVRTTPQVCPVHEQAGRGYLMRWSWSYKIAKRFCVGTGSQTPSSLITEQPLQALNILILKTFCVVNCLHTVQAILDIKLKQTDRQTLHRHGEDGFSFPFWAIQYSRGGRRGTGQPPGVEANILLLRTKLLLPEDLGPGS